MKKTIALVAALLLLLCACQQPSPVEPLSEAQVEALRQDYPMCSGNVPDFDMAFNPLEVDLQRVSDTDIRGFALVTITSKNEQINENYSYDSGTAEAALSQKMNGTSSEEWLYNNWNATVDRDLLGTIPDYAYQDGETILIGHKTWFDNMYPDLQPGQQYIVMLSIFTEKGKEERERPDVIENMCFLNGVFYVTESGHVLSSLYNHREYDGMPLEQFCNTTQAMVEQDKVS